MRFRQASIDLMEPTHSIDPDVLDGRLADCLDLKTYAKQVPCHVMGPYLSGLHRLFDDINDEVERNLDTIAKRGTYLEGALEETTRDLAAESSLLENSVTRGSGRDQVISLADSLTLFRNSVRQAIGQANEVGDAVTARVLAQVSRGIDRWLWMVQANLQER